VADRVLNDLVGAVIDRETIDWPNVDAHLGEERQHRIAGVLRQFSLFLSGRPEIDLFSSLRRRLPRWMETIRWIAVLLAVLGLAGTAVALRQLDTSQPALALVPFIFTVLLAFFVAALALDWSARDRRARALGFCYWAIAVAFGAGGVTWLRTRVPGIWFADALRPEVFLGAGLWLFAREFPRTTRYSRLDTICRIGFWIATVSGAVLFLANLAFGVFSVIPGVPASVQRQAVTGWFWNVHFAIALPALAAVALRARMAPPGEVARVRLFLLALALAIVPVAALVISSSLFPSLLLSLRSSRLMGAWIVYPPILALPFVTMYAVTATDVLPVRLVIRSGVRHIVVGRLLLAAVVLPAAWLMVYLYDNRQRTLADALADQTAVRLAWIVAGAAILLFFRRMLLLLLDRWSSGDPGHAPRVLARLAATLRDARTPMEVATLLSAAIEQALQAPAERYLMRFGRLAPVDAEGSLLPERSMIPEVLRLAGEPCLIGEGLPRSLFRFLSADDQTWVTRSGTALVVPLMTRKRSGALIGMVSLRDRANAFSFGPQDLQFLRTGAASAALACDALQADGNDTQPFRDQVALECSRCGSVVDWDDGSGLCTCGGSRKAAVLPKQIAGRFEIIRRLGAGGMGVVYLSSDRILGREVAVKTLTWLSQSAAERSLDEARAMASVTHPNIAVLYGSEWWQSTPVLVLEYLPLGTLARRLEGGVVPLSEAVAIARQVASALERVHATGRCHGDVKPSNIGFAADGTPKLLDFGLSRAIVSNARESTDVAMPAWGTPAYLSPEVWAGGPADERLDVWALSVVLCEMMAGRHPYGAARTRGDIARRSARTIADLSVYTTGAVCVLLEEVLCDRGRGRPHTATELRQRLQLVVDIS
jgi:hypothetical protein